MADSLWGGSPGVEERRSVSFRWCTLRWMVASTQLVVLLGGFRGLPVEEEPGRVVVLPVPFGISSRFSGGLEAHLQGRARSQG